MRAPKQELVYLNQEVQDMIYFFYISKVEKYGLSDTEYLLIFIIHNDTKLFASEPVLREFQYCLSSQTI